MKELTHEQAHSFIQSPMHLMASERVLLNDHLSNCPDCRAYADEVKQVQTATVNMLHRRWDSNTPDPSLNRSILARLKRNKLQKQMFTMAGTIAGIALVLVVFFLIQSPIINKPINSGEPTSIPIAVGLLSATPGNTTLSIGILAGYELSKETGETCPDGTTEADVTLKIANLVKDQFEAEGYSIEVLDTIDNRMNGEKKGVLIVLQTNTCEAASGATFTGLDTLGNLQGPSSKSAYLTGCLSSNYSKQTGLLHPGVSFSRDIGYIFNRHEANSAVAHLVLGSLGADRNVLVDQPELAARGITNGLKCFMQRPWESYSVHDSYAQILKDPTNAVWHGYLGLLYFDQLDYERALIELGCAVDGCITKEDTVEDPQNAPELWITARRLNNDTLEFYTTYSSVLATLASSQPDYCLRVHDLNQQLKDFAPDAPTVSGVVSNNNFICAQIFAAQSNAPITIGLLAGPLSADNTTGYTCANGATEASVTLNIANQVQAQLEAEGYLIEVLDEVSERVTGEAQTALVALQTGNCKTVSGALIVGVSLFEKQKPTNNTNYLTTCLVQAYSQQTGLSFMRDPEPFAYSVNRYTHESAVAQIILGNLGGDRDILVDQPQVAATAIADGLRCYVERLSDTMTAEAATGLPSVNTNKTVGLLAGNKEDGSQGASCSFRGVDVDEATVTLEVAHLVEEQLEAQGYVVDVLDEPNERRDGYKGSVLIGLQTGGCNSDSGAAITGLELSGSPQASTGLSLSLAGCLSKRYVLSNRMDYLDTEQTLDPHTSWVAANTAVAIVRLGSLISDSYLLVDQPELVAETISEGIQCYFDQRATVP